MKLSLGRQLLLAILLGVFASSGCVDLDNFIQSGKPNNQSLQDPFFAGNEINFNVLTNLSVKRFTLIETLSNTELKDDGRQVLVVSDPSRKVVICVPDRRKQASMAPISPFSTVLDKNQEWAWIEFDPADERRPGYSACKWIDGGLFDHQETKEPIIIDLKKVLSDNPKLTFCYVGHGFDWLEISLAKTMVESRITLNSLRNGRVVTHCSGEDLESVVSGSAININPLSSPPDLCLVLVDSLRPDHLGCYGYERDTSPAIDAFAAGAVRFDQAIASGCGRSRRLCR